MKKQILVVGLGRFGVSVATTLQDMGHDVLAIDDDEKNVMAVTSQLTRAVQADATNENVLRSLGVKDFDVAIVAISSAVESSVLCTVLLKTLGVRHIIARASERMHGRILEKIGADVVVYPEQEMGIRTAHRVFLRDASNYLPVGKGYGIASIAANPYFVGVNLGTLEFGPRGKWEIALLLLQRKNEVVVTPDDTEILHKDDILIVAGSDDRIERFLTEAKRDYKEPYNMA
jgi:trk system potassium uptake protein